MKFMRILTPHSLDWVVSLVRMIAALIGALARGLAGLGRRFSR